ncbi:MULTISPECIES: sulfotransferase [unclassified Sphingopyxis]|jgi:tetratricopeptide (TPR) repeat protein|uniref:tetratricopeptide repeat-containing sulfotransferase family protein n=1 Tax=unclassified Sphingopyxis TaxID=2614943 RepID=UPI0028658345|nr:MULTISPECIES: sulfotransferase [unclassified Sphingopyxis]MDR6833719.1 tetratricopeptide (TPR) repeat protein [Sphingopyxis sp. BE122]MDR7225988.1 tetratricopeptide (TPR) repeat protein [Sphingopyxis sp. BE259]
MATVTHDAALANARRLLAAEPASALAQAEAIIEAVPTSAAAHRLAAHALRALNREQEAQGASLAAVGATIHDEAMVDAALALAENRLPDAEAALRQRLREDATDVAAIRMLAEVAGRIGRYGDAEKLLTRALELAPGFGAARANLATVYYKQNRYAEAAETLDAVLGDDPDNPAHANLKAAALGRIGGYDEAIGLYEQLTRRFPDHAKLWMSYGHMLKTVGRQDESIAAYRHALGVDPGLGELWWSLANLKTIRFDASDRAAMEAALVAADPADEARADDRLHLHFALGKAYDDAGDAEPAFRHYAAGNAIRGAQLGYDAADTSAIVDAAIATCTTDFFAERAGAGEPAPDPIFILGMPRAGSTLVEQILASHSAIEGTMELPDIPALALGLGRETQGEGRHWIAALAEAPPERLAEMGAAFLRRTAVQRKTDKPLYIDKLPNNWRYVPLIRLILPNARIIDARRHPLDCCWSNFRQHYAKGQAFSYDLADMGAYYRDYVRLMAHIDAVQPGRVHRVIHEAVLDNPEAEVRAVLAYLGLPFEDACMAFHANVRAVRTASSEQVRRPINRDGVDQWRPYDAWLDPLKTALGSVLDAYPQAPRRFD